MPQSYPAEYIGKHGAKVPSDSDGYPEAWYASGQSAICHYPNAQDAATLWYHDHTLGINRLNVYAGLAGSGMAVPSGRCPTVGVGGLLLGGGFGFSSRHLGLTCDHLLHTQRFYEKHGYERHAVLRGFYAADDDMVVYRRDLS